MPPLTRQDTVPSIHSWWSDSNSAVVHGPTINIHAVVKPLLKRMYHRQALQFIKKNRGSPLSKATLEIYSSYFPWDWVSSLTKEAILEELIARSEYETEARAMIDSPVLHGATQLLGSPDVGARISACKLLASLAKFSYTRPAILELKSCEQLVSLLRSELSSSAMYLLSQIAQTSDGAQTVVDAKVLDDVLVLLGWPVLEVRYWTCALVGRLAGHDSSAPAVLKLNPCAQLLTLLRNNDFGTTTERTTDRYAFSQIARWPDGAQAIINAGALDLVLELFDSPSLTTRKWTCELVEVLASHDSTVPAMLELGLCGRLVSLLFDANFEVIRPAAHALSQIARWPDGAQAIVDAGGLDLVLELLESSSPTTRKWTCQLVGNVASHQSTFGDVLALKPFKNIASLLSDEDSGVINGAVIALSQISEWRGGARAIVEAGALDRVSELLKSSRHNIRKYACELVGSLASHDSTRATVLALKTHKQLVALLCDENSGVVTGALLALRRVALSFEGVQAIVEAGALDHVPELLESLSPNIRRWTCVLVGNLARHDSIRAAVLALKPYKQLVGLLRDEGPGVMECVVYALCLLAFASDAAQSIVDARALDHLSELLESPNHNIRAWTCRLVGNLASHDSTRAVVLALKPCKQLVALLRDEDPGLIERALYTLSWVAFSLDGAQAVVDAGALDHVPELLKSSSRDIRKVTCKLVGKLASYELALPAILELEPCKQLVSCLREPGTRARAIFALCAISKCPDGVATLADLYVARKLQVVIELPDTTTVQQIRTITDNISQYMKGIGIAL
ncbi:hypothetical protein MVEN_01351100 [Mycena venus]|uniref:ARM repeat-containing protein n=1 Tax=Mycena venus TaxID=2733690 RepID=A0A8H7CWC6_9AGAR|nr:hypothetical protein MVEN_01351100 [Mycena venus]